jgi:hypothetical protein
MTEISELIDALSKEGGIFSDVEAAASGAEADAAWSKFASSSAFGDLTKDLDNFRPFQEDGEIKFRKGTDGEPIKISELKERLTVGNYVPLMEDMGITVTDEMKATLEKQEQMVSQLPGQVDIKTIDESAKSGEDASKINKTPTAEDPEVPNDKNGTIEELKKMMKDAADDKKEIKWGKWVESGLFLGVAGFGAYEFWKTIEDHKHACNGCWLVSNNGNKCKIAPLSCNADDRNAASSTCGYCSDEKKCTNTDPALFNPCLIGSKAKTGSSGNMPGAYTPDSKDATTACTVCSACVIQCDGSDTCSPDCSSSKFNVPVGYTMKCVNLDWWGALADAADAPINFAKDQLMKILKILGIVLAIVIVLGIIYFVISKELSSRKSKEE